MDGVCCEVSAPGKVILHGEHSVVYGKTAVAAGLGLRTTSKLEEYDHEGDLMFTIVLPKVECKVTLSQNILKDIPMEMSKLCETPKIGFSRPKDVEHDKLVEKITLFLNAYRTTHAIRGTEFHTQSLIMIIYLFRGIIINNIDEPRSLLLTVDSELTIGAGTGSSASFAVSLSGVMLQYVKYKNLQRYYTTVQRQYISEDELLTLDQRKFTEFEKYLISDWAFGCERIAHGSPSGVDNATCTFGAVVEFKKGEKPKHHMLSNQLKILLVDTKVSRQTKILVQKVADLKLRCPQVVTCIMDALNHTAVAALEVIKKMNHAGGIVADLGQSASNQSDYMKQLAELFDINHKLLSALGVSHETLEKIKTKSWEHGFSAKLTGAGGGGFAIVLLPPTASEESIRKLTDVLINEGFEARVTEIGVEGVKATL